MSGYNTWQAQYLIVLISFTSGELDFTNSARELQELESGIMTSEAFRLTLQEPGDKCPRSLLEYELFKSKKSEYPRYPRLRDIKKLYPGDKFTLLDDTWCYDRHEVEGICKIFGENGMCNGTYVEMEKYQRSTNQKLDDPSFAEKYGFSLIPLDEPQPMQIMEMVMHCRETCKNLYKDTPYEELPDLVKKFGGFEDVIPDNFGHPLPLCSIKDGFIPRSAHRAIAIIYNGYHQENIVPALHKVGFQKMKIPKDIYLTILNNRKKMLNTGRKWLIETCDQGMQNCVKPMESDKSQECHLVSRENYFLLNLERSVKEEIFEKLRVLAQEWIGDVVELAGTSVYGIRKYARGAFLLGHLDHLKTHVVSAILNIQQKVDSPWPLQIYDHNHHLHEIILQPGEMVWYESAKMVHGRVKPLNGSSFENVFVHYMPKSKAWFREDISMAYKNAHPPVTLESIKEADDLLKLKKEKLKEEVESMEKHLESLDFEQRTKLRNQITRENLQFDNIIS